MHDTLVGGIGLTILDVYHQRPGPDGITAGCAHVHALTDEAYFGLSGTGALELHDAAHGFRSVPIEPGTYVQFPAGTLHRSVSTDRLRVLAVMGNAGLPEQGDARIYFGAEVDRDPERYEALKGLVRGGLEGALERRDASARAYQELMQLWLNDRSAYFQELDRFVSLHRQGVAGQAVAMTRTIQAGPLRQATQALARLTGGGDLSPDTFGRWAASDAPVVYGMCGLLHQVSTLADA